MPDFSKCSNQECPLSKYCWRFNCPPSEYSQSYHEFEPTMDNVVDGVTCNNFIDPPKENTPD